MFEAKHSNRNVLSKAFERKQNGRKISFKFDRFEQTLKSEQTTGLVIQTNASCGEFTAQRYAASNSKFSNLKLLIWSF